jgi:hypothetical protein
VPQARSEECSPVQLLQLLQPDLYPEADAASVRRDAAARASSSLFSLLRRIGAASWGLLCFRQMPITRRSAFFTLFLVAVTAVLMLRRGAVLRVVLRRLKLALQRVFTGWGYAASRSGS